MYSVNDQEVSAMKAAARPETILADPAPQARPAMRWLAIEQVIPYENNPRNCSERGTELLAASIATNGFLSPIITDERLVILAGHQRLAAAKSLGLPQVPVVVAVGLSAAQAKAYRLMDNRSHEETSWNPRLLQAELAELVGMAVDPALTGFSAEELATLLAPTVEGTLGLCDPDALVEPPRSPITKRGDIWVMGRHRLCCGDASDVEQVAALMADQRALLLASDPPYGVGYNGGNHPQTWSKGGRAISSAAKTKSWDDYREAALGELFAGFLGAAQAVALSSRPVIYTFFAMMRAPEVFAAWAQAGLLAHQVIVWAKTRAVLGRSDFMYDYEPALYGWIKGKRPAPQRRPPAAARALWSVSSAIEDGQSGLHPTQKPVELVRRPIDYHTRVGELIYEPFAGSGTAIIAAEMTGRSCYAMELSPAFCDAARLRWQRFTGKTATRQSVS
jgi:DNA modification methylase